MMRMDEIGYNHKHPSDFYIDRPDGVGDWLLLIIKTPVLMQTGTERKHIRQHTFILYTPGHPQYYGADGGEYRDDWMHFEPDSDELALMQSLSIPFNQPVTFSDTTDLSAFLRNMCYEHYSANLHRQETVDLYFRLMIYKLHEKLQSQHAGERISEHIYFEQLMWIRESIYRWPGRDYSIDDMAKELSLSRSRFQHLYSETFGISVSQDLIHSRMERSAELLRGTELSVKEIGSLVGYSNTAYFIKLFGRTFGLTPVKFRHRETTRQDES